MKKVLNRKEDIKEALNRGGILVGLCENNAFTNVKAKDINMLYKKYKNDDEFCYYRLGDKLGYGNGGNLAWYLFEEGYNGDDKEVEEFLDRCGYCEEWWNKYWCEL